jgi:hypothetical protein
VVSPDRLPLSERDLPGVASVDVDLELDEGEGTAGQPSDSGSSSGGTNGSSGSGGGSDGSSGKKVIGKVKTGAPTANSPPPS